jgi:enoyl-[acyl-carrier protein] reductase II
MVWVSGAKLAAAVSNAGGLGLIGAGSMKPEILRTHILKAQSLTKKPFGVNVPLLYDKAQEQIDCALELGVRIFFTSAGSPKLFTSYLKNKGAIVVHVTSTPELALKCQEAGVDAVVTEGFEAGGHNGRDEITTLTLIPQVRAAIKIPLIAAGGIATGSGIAAVLSLGADGVQMGTRFLMSNESSAHENFKKLALKANSNSTSLFMRKYIPVRLLTNDFSEQIKTIEENYLGPELKEKLIEHLGKYRAKKGMLEGDISEGELEIGQIVSLIKSAPSVAEIMKELIDGYQLTLSQLPKKL